MFVEMETVDPSTSTTSPEYYNLPRFQLRKLQQQIIEERDDTAGGS